MNNKPEPLTPADCDLRDFAYMPLDVVRLRDSETAALLTPGEFRAAILLWCAAWHQVPAASLPNDDRLLAMLAGFGRYRRGWSKVKEGALRGFIECKDGRLYHPVVAEKALQARQKLHKQKRRTAAATAARVSRAWKNNNKNNEDGPRNDNVTSNVTVATKSTKGIEGNRREGNKGGGGGVRARDLGPAAERALIAGPLFHRFANAYPGPVSDTGATRQTFLALYDAGHADAVIAAAESYGKSMVGAGYAEPVDEWLARRAWEGATPTKSQAPLISPEAHDLANEVAKIAGFADPLDWPPGWCGAPQRAQTWLAEGWRPEVILTACRASMAAKRDGPPHSIKYFERAIARAVADQSAPLPQVVINHKPEVIHVEAGGARPASSYGASRDRAREAVAKLQAYARSGEGGE